MIKKLLYISLVIFATGYEHMDPRLYRHVDPPTPLEQAEHVLETMLMKPVKYTPKPFQLKIEKEEYISDDPLDIQMSDRKAFWKVGEKRHKSHLRHLTNTDVLVIVILAWILGYVCLLFGRSFGRRDAYANGFVDGVHSEISKLAKLRHPESDGLIVSEVPVDLWDEACDEYTCRSWFRRQWEKFISRCR